VNLGWLNLRRLTEVRVILLNRQGPIAIGRFPGHSWHVGEKENIVGKLGMKVERGEVPDEAMNQGTFYTVSRQEHNDIVKAYIEKDVGMAALGKRMNRSNATIKSHLDSHNQAVKRSGFCPRCRKMKGPYEEVLAAWAKF
jgi:hypothetical protein